MPPNTETRRPVQAAPRLALSPDEAAATLGVSRDFLDEHILPELRIVRRGRRRLIPIRELERWLADNAARTLDQTGQRRRSDSWMNEGFRASVGDTKTGGRRGHGPAPAPGG